MVAVSCHQPSIDHRTLVQLIRGVFARSPIFREAVISELLSGPDGEAIVDVSFGHGRTAFRVVASTEDDVCAILCDLAFAVSENDQSRRAV
jgi:hypothetical protein